MTKIAALPPEALFALAAVALVIGLGVLFFANQSLPQRHQPRLWIELSGHLFTVAAILASTGGLIASLNLDYRGAESEQQVLERERTLREQVLWKATVHHDPNVPDLDVELRCFKTADTIEPKQVEIELEVEYQDARGFFTPDPPRKVFSNVHLTPISTRELSWKVENIQDSWEDFKDREGRIAREEVLNRPLALNIDIRYNLDFIASGKAHLYPDYLNPGVAGSIEEVELMHTDESLEERTRL